MPVTMKTEKEGLVWLLNKYDVPYTEEDIDASVPLQPWRCTRKYVELRNLVKSGTVEHPCLLRFCHLTDSGTSLEDLLYREFDLAEFITGQKIAALHAAFTDGRSGSVIIRLDNGVVGSVEVGNQIPCGEPEVDRHEIVARRGVASDIAVDTQIPQQSIYLFKTDGDEVYKDTDSELFGLSDVQIENVRAKFAFLKDRASKDAHLAQDARLRKVVKAALESNETKKKITL